MANNVNQSFAQSAANVSSPLSPYSIPPGHASSHACSPPNDAADAAAEAVKGEARKLYFGIKTNVGAKVEPWPCYRVIEWTSQNEMAGTAMFLKIMVADPAAGLVNGDYSMASDGTANRRA